METKDRDDKELYDALQWIAQRYTIVKEYDSYDCCHYYAEVFVRSK